MPEDATATQEVKIEAPTTPEVTKTTLESTRDRLNSIAANLGNALHRLQRENPQVDLTTEVQQFATQQAELTTLNSALSEVKPPRIEPVASFAVPTPKEIVKLPPRNRESERSYMSEYLAESMKEPLINLTNQLKDNLAKGDYSLFIGDDLGSRLFTLAMKEIAGSIADKNGVPRPEVRFVLSSRSIDRERIKKQVNTILDKLPPETLTKRVLLLTDFISTGGTVNTFAQTLNEREVKFDVAALGARSSEETYKQNTSIPADTTIFRGGDEQLLRSGGDYGGVFFEPDSQKLRVARGTELAKVSMAREDIKVLAQEVTASIS